ncbi:methyl-accepting chemotaxis protein [Rhodoplanes sp. TEM]|uniref:Methyl-accepting chemotaxis protein n=1 Tax=Rhodoplanes tepidamans TaxID=200616 RepID=A0ABT5J7U1_RHOTP|nr:MULTISPECIES: methyl-accepting chemotaxis protein [Rhodoplanes]MDC7785651.1 methyl-accepting chemotaxis protein [Rhodoplanes tepidamans]MDC7983292.1 methyl-accepting chemotaxis protein [Rhodoplanes sp. TEM]MDQ0354782.1 methyl-accepting chemotaxis protein [Rhodoplanes tepidamans]
MRRLALFRLLLVLGVVPVLGLVLFGGQLAWDSWNRYADLARASSVLRLAVATSRLAAVLPPSAVSERERISGTGDRARTDTMRRTVDSAYAAVQAASTPEVMADPTLARHLRELGSRLEKYVELRAQIDAGKISNIAMPTIVGGPATAQAVDLVGAASAIVSDPALSRRIVTLYTTLQFADSLLIQRGAGMLSLQDGKLTPENWLLIARGVVLNGPFGKLFAGYAPRDVVAQLEQFNAANGREMQTLRDRALRPTGEAATPDQVKRWSDLNGEQTVLLGKIMAQTIDSVAAEGEGMLSDALRDLIIYLGVVVVVIAIVAAVGRSILRIVRSLIGELVAVIDSMRDGNFTIAIPHTDRSDEIGAMARAIDGFRENFVRAQQEEAEHKAAADGQARKALMEKVATEFEAVIGGVVETVSTSSAQLESVATALTRAADTTQEKAGAVSAASEEASTNVQAVAAATNEMTSSIGEIGRQVQASSRIAAAAVDQAARTDTRVTQLSQAAARIGDVVKLITAIAEQTNLLALNATIEAARAGEAGKGFAVVAQEVKALAAQTAKATGDISAQIAEMQAATQDSVGAIKEIGGTIGQIAEIAAAIAAAVEEQGAATGEIARNIQQASQGTAAVAATITDVNRGAGETGAASTQLLASAQALARESRHLRTEVGKFLQTVRAA